MGQANIAELVQYVLILLLQILAINAKNLRAFCYRKLSHVLFSFFFASALALPFFLFWSIFSFLRRLFRHSHHIVLSFIYSLYEISIVGTIFPRVGSVRLRIREHFLSKYLKRPFFFIFKIIFVTSSNAQNKSHTNHFRLWTPIWLFFIYLWFAFDILF